MIKDKYSRYARHKLTWSKILLFPIYISLFLWAIISLYPIIFMFITALKTDPEIMGNIWALPSSLHFENFLNAWQGGELEIPISRYFLNSIIITASTLILVAFIGSLAGFSLAKYKFPGNIFTQRFFVWVLAIPIHATLIPIFYFLGSIGMRNTYWGLTGIYTAFWLPFTILIMQAYFKSFPGEVVEAARIDGCGELGIFLRVVLPMSRGNLAGITIINAVGIWSELLFAFVVMTRGEMKTLTSGIMGFAGQYQVSWSLIFAGLSIASLPTIILFLILQKQITKGMAMGTFR